MTKRNFDFIGKRKIFLIVSAAILLIGILANIIMGTQLDITFKGGAIFTYSFSDTNVDQKAVTAIAKEFLGDEVEVDFTKDISGNTMQATFTLTEIPSTVITYNVTGAGDKASLEKLLADKGMEVFGCETRVSYDEAKKQVAVDPVNVVSTKMVELYTTALQSLEDEQAPVFSYVSANTVNDLANLMYDKMVETMGTKVVYKVPSATVTSTDVLEAAVETALLQKVTGGDNTLADVTFETATDVTDLTMTPGEGSLAMDNAFTKVATETLQAELGDTDIAVASETYNAVTLVTSNSVKSTVGKGFFIKCLFAMVLGGAFLTLYIGIRFRKIGGVSAGLFATFALIHDILIAYMAYVIFQIPLNDNFIAVVLTILGYSINGTIVIYDRIRENERKYGGTMTLPEIVNASVNQTFTRNVFTTLSTLIAVVAIAVVAKLNGLDSIISFAFPMAVGLLAGFYSSVFLSSPMWAWWRTRK